MASTSIQTIPSSFTSAFSKPQPEYDVFLSFRGEDARNKFTDHLYHALNDKKIITFRDDKELEMGKPDLLELLEAIEKSKIAVIIFSKNYASSTWCLEQLAKIVECRDRGIILRVLPIFYHVEPTDVRHQKNIFAEAFAKHEKRFEENPEKVQKWRTALTNVANLSGMHLKDGCSESKLLQKIVEEILDIETTLKAKVITPEQDESNKEDPSSLFLEEKSSLPPTQGAGESSLPPTQGAGESSLPMSQTPNSRNEADVLTSTWSNQDGVQDLSFESIKVSEISELMDLPTRVHSLRIEGCDDLEFIPKGVMSSEPSLQDLYIINCCSLKSFPKDHPPTALKILYIRNCKKLNFPLTTEKKTHQDALLEYLCIGSSCDSLKSISLDLFPNLKSLSIWDCANLELLSMPVQKNLTSLEALEIRDCPNLVSFLGGGLHTMNLTSVWLSNCKKLEKLPELHTLGSLQSMFINNCPELVSLSEKGLPSRLSLLSITFCNKLKLKDEWGLDGLDYLRRLEIEGGCVDVGSFPEKFLPSNLSSLRISGLLNLKTLDNRGFQQLTALQRLEISCCPNLQSFPEDGFPSSLSFLCIKECPLLTSKFRNKKGKDWSKIDHISCIEIDEEVIS